MTLVGGWHTPEVARAQRDLVMKELRRPYEVGPFKAFLDAMAHLGLESGALLDVGCGVGHYAILCEIYYPGILYHGTDASEAIIAEARLMAPLAHFSVCDFGSNIFGEYDIVLASQVIEIAGGDRWANLELLLSKSSHYVILNRIRLTENVSHEIEETTYCGYSGKEWLWNQFEIESVIVRHGIIVDKSIWDNGNEATYIVETNCGH